MATGISSPGVGSGLDVEGMVKKLVQAEAEPPTKRLNNQEQRYEQELSALGKFKSALGDFQGAADGLSDFENFASRAAQSSDPETVEVSADGTAEEGRYNVNVEQLAGNHKLVSQSGAIQSPDEPLGSGTLTFQFGEYGEDGEFRLNDERGSTSISVTSDNNTVHGIRDAINDADIGVRANVVSDGNGPRLVMTSTETGAENSIRITAENGQGGLERLATVNPDGSGMQQLEAGRDAVASIDGVPVRSASNELTDTIDGVNFTLGSEGSADVEVALDRDKARNAVGGFVEGYNQLMQTVNELTSWDAEAEEGGPLNGDSTVRMVVSRLQQSISTPVDGLEGPYQSLADLGFRTNKDGTLAVDQQRLDQAINEDPEAVGHLFARSGEAADPLVDYVDSSDDTEPGSYMVDVDAEPSRGAMVGERA
ncbi:MAG: flagellar filament capping protein FliD, partial [Thiohalospira sp.]